MKEAAKGGAEEYSPEAAVLAYIRSLFMESDRGFVLLAFERVDELLKDLHIRHIHAVSRPSNKLVSELFGWPGPVSSPSARIKLAFAYGLMSQDEFANLEVVREIRNKAAHSRQDFGFGFSFIQELVSKLEAPLRIPPELQAQLSESKRSALQNPSKDENTTKMYFLLTVECLASAILILTLETLKQQQQNRLSGEGV